MYGFGQNFPYRKLKDISLELVCFTQSTFFMHFEKKITISVMGDIEINDFSGSLGFNANCAEPMMKFIGQKLLSATIVENSRLILKFERDALTLIDDPNFEAFVFEIDDETIYV